MIGQVKIKVKTRQVAAFLLLQLVDLEFRKKHPSFGMVGVGQREEAFRENVLLQNLLRRHAS